MTTCRLGSTPSDSDSRPAAATSSCTTLRSNALIGVERLLLARGLDLVDRHPSQLDECLATLGAVAGDVEHQPAALTGLDLHGQPGELLQGLEHLAVLAHQPAGHAALVGVDDGHGCPVAVDVDVEVTVEVGDVEERLEEVGRDLALPLQLAHA